jgi:hypothetical protein
MQAASLAVKVNQNDLTMKMRFAFGDETTAGAAKAELAELLRTGPDALKKQLDAIKAIPPNDGEAAYKAELVHTMEALILALPKGTVRRKRSQVGLTLVLKTPDPGLALLVLLPKKKKNP